MPCPGLRVNPNPPRKRLVFCGVERRRNLSHPGTVNFRNGFLAGLVVAVIWGVWLVRIWQPDRQVELHSLHFLEAIEKKNWKTAAEFINDDYQDRWGNDRSPLLVGTVT